MAAGMLTAALLLAQGAVPAFTVEGALDRSDVGYEALVAGDPDQAIIRIKAEKRHSADDPAALINLGTAYARLGRMDTAKDCYRAAMLSSDRYLVQLHDGRWLDSRHAARLAERGLAKGRLIALR